MKKALIFISALALFSCGNQTEEVMDNVQTKEEATTCIYSYSNSTEVNWTAFKLSEKVGVSGTFDSVVVSNINEKETIEEMLKGATFSIYTSTVNSNDSLRDWKIANHFFGVMDSTVAISGSVKSLENGQGEVNVMMNGLSVDVPVTYSLKEESAEVMIETTINVPDWSQPALDKLNEVCSEKHTGPDGVNKLWPDVEVKVFVGFDKICD